MAYVPFGRWPSGKPVANRQPACALAWEDPVSTYSQEREMATEKTIGRVAWLTDLGILDMKEMLEDKEEGGGGGWDSYGGVFMCLLP
jgi:hypothetical protein